MEMSPTVAELAKALCKTQSIMDTAKKDSTNPHFNSKYADIASCWEACRKPLTDNGLSVSQYPETDGTGKITLTTVLLHNSGEWMRGTLSIVPKDGANPQVFGSIVTYFRRYGLQSAVGIASDDDDGNAGAGSQGAVQPAKRPAPAPKPEAVNPVVQPPATVENPPPATTGKEPEKTPQDLRHELGELAQIAVDAGVYSNTGDAIQDFASTEKFKSKCRGADGLKESWQLKRAIEKASAVLNSIPRKSSLDEPPSGDIPF